ncbi:hypothetical protein OQO70_004747, partial [Citrobacter freundii]
NTKIFSIFCKHLSKGSAQCSPRHACPLPGALLMQMHEVAQAAPVLVRRGVENSGFCMQSHAA